MSDRITAPDNLTRTADKKTVTGSNAGDKRGLDVNMLGSVEGSFSPSGLKVGGKVTEVNINSTTWTALPATALTNRNAMSIQNRSGQEIKINYVDDVGYVGVIIPNSGERFYDITDAITIYARSSDGNAKLNIEELA